MVGRSHVLWPVKNELGQLRRCVIEPVEQRLVLWPKAAAQPRKAICHRILYPALASQDRCGSQLARGEIVGVKVSVQGDSLIRRIR